MSLLGEATYTRRRYAGSAWVAGRWVRATPTTATFRASKQRLRGWERQVREQGHRGTHVKKLITECLGFLRTTDQHGTTEADEVLIDGAPYVVTHIDNDHPEIPYEAIFVARIDEVSPDPVDSILTCIASAARTWFVQQAVQGGIPAADGRVIFADEPGPRPPLPYVVVDVPVLDERLGRDEVVVDDSDPPQVSVRAFRAGMVSLHAYGDGALTWLERAQATLQQPASQTTLTTEGLNLEPVGGTQNLTSLLETQNETYFRQDYQFTYQRLADPADAETGVELAQVVHTDEFGDRTTIVTENL